MARSDRGAGIDRGEAAGQLRSHPALIALVQLLARQAARDALTASRLEQEIRLNDDED